MGIISKIKRNIKNFSGWSTKRRIIVIESDDWGSIRMPSKEVYQTCLNHGYRVDQNVFTKYDSLASEEDLTSLFHLLTAFKDGNGNHPIITANCLVANPDFDKIRENGFQQYHYELITETFSKYPKHMKCFRIWQQGFENKVFKPQCHGREHLNVARFLDDLRTENDEARFAFNYLMPGIFKKENVKQGNDYIVSLEYRDEKDKLEKDSIITDGLEKFELLFGFPSLCFTPPNNVWHPDYEEKMYNSNVRFILGSRYQLVPKGGYAGFSKINHYTGQMNKFNQIYFVRNAHFEPSFKPDGDTVSACLKEIEAAFYWNKPAIITSHRINYVGFIDNSNRDNSLRKLEELLTKIIRRFPNVEFLTSDQLGQEIIKNRTN